MEIEPLFPSKAFRRFCDLSEQAVRERQRPGKTPPAPLRAAGHAVAGRQTGAQYS